MKEEKKEITINEVMDFIFSNCNETELMDKINKITFPFTSKYDRFYNRKDVRIWWNYQPSYDDLKDFIERPDF